MSALVRKEGASYRVTGVEADYFKLGDIVYLIKDDGSDCPWFSTRKDANYYDVDVEPIEWDALEDYPLISITITATCDGIEGVIPMTKFEDLTAAQKLAFNKLSDENKVLFQNDLIHLDGTVTSTGLSLANQYAFEAYKSTIATDIAEQPAVTTPVTES